MKRLTSRTRLLGLADLLRFLWKLFGVLGAVLSLRRWWRTLINDEEPRGTRVLAGFLLVLMAALIVLAVLPSGLDARRTGAAATTTRLVVDLRDDLSDEACAAVGRDAGLALRANSPFSAEDHLLLADVPSWRADAVLDRLRRDPRVEAADLDDTYTLQGERVGPATLASSSARGPRTAKAPNDPRYNEQWNFALIGMEQAWERSTGKGAVVAVIDTGCAFEREGDIPVASDLKETKFVKAYDFVNHKKRAYDDHGHGTHVAGTIAQSTNNGHGVAGIAYEATIMPLKVLSAQGSGSVADIAEAIEYAAKNGANIINMSLGGPRGNAVMRRACTFARDRGVTIVCAAGNSGRQGVGYPAAYPECIAVSSVGPSGNLAFYSSWGEQVAIAAPGGEYRGESERGNGVLQNTVFAKTDTFEFWQGTSMASPHVAGVAALIWANGIKTPAAILNQLKSTATPKGDPLKYGAGVLNAAAAVGAKAEAVSPVSVPAHLPAGGRPWSAAWLGLSVLALGLLTAARRSGV